jgi:hypothetical protein
LIVAGLLIARAGFAMRGAPMMTAAIVAAGGGWVIHAARITLERRRARPSEPAAGSD